MTKLGTFSIWMNALRKLAVIDSTVNVPSMYMNKMFIEGTKYLKIIADTKRKVERA